MSIGNPGVGLSLRDAMLNMTRNPTRLWHASSLVANSNDDDAIATMAGYIKPTAERAAVYYATSSVSRDLGAAARALQQEHLVRFYREDFPTPFGLMVFDGDDYELPSWGTYGKQTLRGILWAVAADALILWSIVHDRSDFEEHARIFSFGGAHFRQMLAAPWGRQMQIVPGPNPQQRAEAEESKGWPGGKGVTLQSDGIVRIHGGDIATFREETEKKIPGYDAGISVEDEQVQVAYAAAAIFRLVYTWTQFVADEIVTVSRAALSRAERRRAEREKTPEPQLNVILLRRVRHERPEGDEIHDVDWKSRWYVHGHWRNQPYGPRDNPEYRAKFITGYIKGPEGKPLVMKDRVIVLGR